MRLRPMAVVVGPSYGPGGQQSGMLGVSMVERGYLRTSKQQQAGMDPETQEHALVSACVPVEHVFRDVGISGTVATTSRRSWRTLQGRLRRGDVVAVAGIGRRWAEVINSVRQLREQGIRIRSLAAAEQVWARYLDADEDVPDYFIGNLLSTSMVN